MFALPSPIRYTPWLKGQYDVAPNLKLLGDEKAFEFDTLWPRIRENKERLVLGRVLRSELDEATAEATVVALAQRLVREWPEFFILGEVIECRLTGERVPLRAEGLDLLATNLPCDLAIVKQAEGRDWTAYLHVSQPSHWRPEEKIGQPFVATHAPIPHFEKVNAAAPKLIDAMISRGPWVRFVWGFETDTELDHHPDRAPGRSFNTKPFVVRTERQVLLPLPEHGASIFLIGVGFVDGHEVLADDALWRPLKAALLGMSPQARDYKGVAEEFEGLLAQFQG
ncbi:DUF3445 domain-containing protein [bacterium]|nr:MAG: DUF3445 domain-containing protein [bacterium]